MTLTSGGGSVPQTPGAQHRAESPSEEDHGDTLIQKTSNVYINGLPPHFPEEQLYELTAPFGPIRSVRSFTRHIGEKESGYGFVLWVHISSLFLCSFTLSSFETIDSAEKCIQSLRRFRNLHPTFSKVRVSYR
jgi:RNA recognition motif-containing protein